MLHEVLKLVTYLSILTTTTSSSYLSKESVANFRRASPSSVSNEQSSQLSSDGEGFVWTEMNNAEPSQSDYLNPKIVNVNAMLYTQLKKDNSKYPKRNINRKLSQKGRGKKDNTHKLINSKNNKLTNLIKNYDNLNKRNSIASSYNDESNNVRNITANAQTVDETNRFNNTEDAPPSRSYPLSNEYPIEQISKDNEHDRELQQLFGIEGAKKYQTQQLQQHMLNDNEQFPVLTDDEGVELKEPQKKRNGDITGEEMQDVSGAMINQIMPRTTRRQREYDVPLIQCPPATDGMERFACPTPDRQGRYRCIDDHVLCDGFIDCPEGADEDRQACMFYKTTKAHLDVLADALLRWARGR